MRHVVSSFFPFFLFSFLAAQEQSPPKANPLTAQASAKLASGDREGACRDALQAALQDPSDENALGLAKLSCEKLKTNLKFQGLKPQRHELAPEKAASPATEPEAARPDEELGGSAVSIPPPPAGRLVVEVTSYGKTLEAQDAVQRGRHAEAAQAAAAAIALDGRNLRAYALLAAAQQSLGRADKALETAQAGLQVNPKSSALLKGKAAAQIKLGDFKGALESSEAAVGVNATDPMAHVLKALALGRLAEREAMFAALRTACALEPAYEGLLIEAQNNREGAGEPFVLPGEARPRAVLAAKRAGLRGSLKEKFLFMGLLLGLAVVFVLLGHSLLVYWTRSTTPPNP